MDRGQIRNRVFNLSEYAPDDAATGYTNWVNAVIQEAYLHIWDESAWHFASKEAKQVIRPDVTSTDNQLGPSIAAPTLAVTNSSRTATFTTGVLETWMAKENAKLDILGREYDIVKITSATVAVIDPPFLGNSTAITSALTDWKIIVRDYKMPVDCREILQVSFSNRVQNNTAYGSVDSIPQRTIISDNMNWQITQNKPDYYVPLPFVHQQVDVHSQPTLSVENSGTGVLTAGTHYIGWSVYNSATGVESSMHSSSITSTAQFNIGITFPKVGKVGWNRKIYFGELQTDGSYKYIPMQDHTGGLDLYGTQEELFLSYDDTVKYTTGANQTVDKSHELYEYLVEHEGVQRFIRFYPRPQAKDYSEVGATGSVDRVEWAFFQLRYLFTPPQLKADTDVPAMPDSFHSLIVCKVMQTVYERLGNAAALQIEEKRYKQKIEVLRARFVTSYDTKCQMGNSWATYTHWYIPTIRVG